MLLPHLLELLITIRLKGMNELLNRHQLNRNDTVCLVCPRRRILLRLFRDLALIQKLVKGQGIGVSTHGLHGSFVLQSMRAHFTLMLIVILV